MTICYFHDCTEPSILSDLQFLMKFYSRHKCKNKIIQSPVRHLTYAGPYCMKARLQQSQKLMKTLMEKLMLKHLYKIMEGFFLGVFLILQAQFKFALARAGYVNNNNSNNIIIIIIIILIIMIIIIMIIIVTRITRVLPVLWHVLLLGNSYFSQSKVNSINLRSSDLFSV